MCPPPPLTHTIPRSATRVHLAACQEQDRTECVHVGKKTLEWETWRAKKGENIWSMGQNMGLLGVGRGGRKTKAVEWGFQPLNHNKQTCKMCPNNNHVGTARNGGCRFGVPFSQAEKGLKKKTRAKGAPNPNNIEKCLLQKHAHTQTRTRTHKHTHTTHNTQQAHILCNSRFKPGHSNSQRLWVAWI